MDQQLAIYNIMEKVIPVFIPYRLIVSLLTQHMPTNDR